MNRHQIIAQACGTRDAATYQLQRELDKEARELRNTGLSGEQQGAYLAQIAREGHERIEAAFQKDMAWDEQSRPQRRGKETGMEGTRVEIDGRRGTVTEVFDDGHTVAVEFDDRAGVVMVVEWQELLIVAGEE